MTQETVCFINHQVTYIKYDDAVYRNICNENEILILFKGQAKRTRFDETLKTTSPHFFYRSGSGKNYKYAGKVVSSRIVQERTENNIIQMEYKINIRNNIIDFDTEIEPVMKDTGRRCFKTNCFAQLGLTPLTRDMTPGVILSTATPLEAEFENLSI